MTYSPLLHYKCILQLTEKLLRFGEEWLSGDEFIKITMFMFDVITIGGGYILYLKIVPFNKVLSQIDE